MTTTVKVTQHVGLDDTSVPLTVSCQASFSLRHVDISQLAFERAGHDIRKMNMEVSPEDLHLFGEMLQTLAGKVQEKYELVKPALE